MVFLTKGFLQLDFSNQSIASFLKKNGGSFSLDHFKYLKRKGLEKKGMVNAIIATQKNPMLKIARNDLRKSRKRRISSSRVRLCNQLVSKKNINVCLNKHLFHIEYFI